MINPAELVDALVAKLRSIPELVAEMEGDPERISAYHDLYPKRVSLPLAIYEMPVPSILVAWQGTTPGSFGAGEAWKHNLSLYLRASQTYYPLFDRIVNGVPTGSTLKMLYTTVHPACHPMDLPSIQRATDEQGTDYFEITRARVSSSSRAGSRFRPAPRSTCCPAPAPRSPSTASTTSPVAT